MFISIFIYGKQVGLYSDKTGWAHFPGRLIFRGGGGPIFGVGLYSR